MRTSVLLLVVLAVCSGCSRREDVRPAVAPSSGSQSSGERPPVPGQPAPATPAAKSAPDEPAPPARPIAAAESTTAPERIYRPSDSRSGNDVERAERLGIRRYASKRLELFTDVDPRVARTLPAVIDQVYEAWVEYFGDLPPDREGTEYQITGYLIQDKDRFAAAEMLPEGIPFFGHGLHRGAEFWMNDQESDYYRRHLLIHEATHCFMTTMPGQRPPLWYMEGMAEFFATHRLDADGTATFGVMPDASENFVGFGRIQLIQEEVASGRRLSLDQASSLGPAEFSFSRTIPYAWSWALCSFLEMHPRYRSRFRALADHLVGMEFYRLLRESFVEDRALLAAEWDQFVRTLEYGYDVPGNAFQTGSDARLAREPVNVDVRADQGWQSTGILVEAGETVQVDASGQVTLAREPKPWISEPQGITVRYAGGRPIGRLLAGFLPSGILQPGAGDAALDVQDVGLSRSIEAPFRAVLYLRVNDFPSELSDNSGTYAVEVSPLK